MLLRSMMCVAVVFAMAGFACAAYVFHVGLQYTDTYDASGNDLGTTNPFTTTTLGNGATQYNIAPGGGAVFHQFEMYLSVSGMGAGENVVFMYYGSHITGATQYPDYNSAPYFDTYAPSVLSYTAIDPPEMPASGGSSAPSSVPWSLNLCNDTSHAFAHQVMTGSTQTGPGNGTFGDYAADIYGAQNPVQFAGMGEIEPYDIGTLTVESTAAGTFELRLFGEPRLLRDHHQQYQWSWCASERVVPDVYRNRRLDRVHSRAIDVGVVGQRADQPAGLQVVAAWPRKNGG